MYKSVSNQSRAWMSWGYLDRVPIDCYLAGAQQTEFRAMTESGSLLAWIEPRNAHEFVGAFVGEDASAEAPRRFPLRPPATQTCSTQDEARQWIKQQAAELDLPIKWISGLPTP